MYEARAVATRWVSDDQPGWVEVLVTGATGKEVRVIDKAPYLLAEFISAEAEYPVDVWVQCEPLGAVTDETVRVRLTHMDAELDVRARDIRQTA